MATIMCLPPEMINIILSYNDISIEDIINFRCVCKQFRWAAKYDKYMEKKFFQRWSSAKKIYDKYKQEKCDKYEQKNTKDFIKTGINCVRQLQNFISDILDEHYHNNEAIDNLIKFHRIFNLDKYFINNILNIVYEENENFIKYSFFIDELKNFIAQSLRRTDCDLTEKYCHIKMFHFMRQSLVRKKLYRYTNRNYKSQLLEKIVTMAAQWLQPERDIFYSRVEASLDNITLEVLDCIRKKYPNHSICSVILAFPQIFLYCKDNNIYYNYWNEEEGTQIIETLQEYMFDKFQFRKWEKSSNRKLEYMCIDYVLENRYGEEVILLVIIHSVARRLGLRCDVIRDNSNFFIFWKSDYATNSRNGRCFNMRSNTYISYHSNFLYSDDLRPARFWQELIYFFLENNNQYNNTFGIMSNGSIQLIRYDRINVLSLSVKKTDTQYTRPKEVKFAVGMIVTHQPANCVGVIVGWHRYLDRHLVTFSTKNEPYSYMHLCELPLYHCRNCNFEKEETNYIILTQNNKMCYVEENSITLTAPRWIDNSEIGRYFYKFEGTHYVPNKMLAKLYPQDAAITAQQHYNNITITSQHCDNIDASSSIASILSKCCDVIVILFFSIFFLFFYYLIFNLYL